jgi:AAA15 family ATPase/GTPase
MTNTEMIFRILKESRARFYKAINKGDHERSYAYFFDFIQNLKEFYIILEVSIEPLTNAVIEESIMHHESGLVVSLEIYTQYAFIVKDLNSSLVDLDIEPVDIFIRED